MAISASQVKELRELTGAGMMDCKNALNATNGDIEAAIDWLRSKGLSKAAKKSGRVAAEGLVGVKTAPNKGAVVEVNSETDFVALNEEFQSLVTTIASCAIESTEILDAQKVNALPFPDSEMNVGEKITATVATIGENMVLRRAAGLQVEDGVVASYIHNGVVDGLGRMGVLVALQSSGNKDVLLVLGKQIAMHIAAINPMAISSDDLDPAIVARERAVFTEQANASGKPPAIIEKMVEGRIRKFYAEVCLLEQVFVIDGENKISDVLKKAEEDAGAEIKLSGFIRMALGDGVEKVESDFAAEVAAAVGS